MKGRTSRNGNVAFSIFKGMSALRTGGSEIERVINDTIATYVGRKEEQSGRLLGLPLHDKTMRPEAPSTEVDGRYTEVMGALSMRCKPRPYSSPLCSK